MKTKFVSGICFLVIFSWSCTRVPITNRRQVNLIPESMLMDMSLTQYNQFIASHTGVPKTDTSSILVTKVGTKISRAIVKYLNAHKGSKRVKGFEPLCALRYFTMALEIFVPTFVT